MYQSHGSYGFQTQHFWTSTPQKQLLVEEMKGMMGYLAMGWLGDLLGGGFIFIFYFHPYLGKKIQFDSSFSNPLKPPTGLCFLLGQPAYF